MDLYYEHQQGNLCRMHAINIALGERRLTPATWHARAVAVGRALKCPDAAMWPEVDMMRDGLTMPLAQILEAERHTWVTLTLAHTTLRDLDDPTFLVDPSVPTIVAFNSSHTWACRFDGKVWHNLDSARRFVMPHLRQPEAILDYARSGATGGGGCVFIAGHAHARAAWLPALGRLATEATGSERFVWMDAFRRIHSVVVEGVRALPTSSEITHRRDPAAVERLLDEVVRPKASAPPVLPAAIPASSVLVASHAVPVLSPPPPPPAPVRVPPPPAPVVPPAQAAQAAQTAQAAPPPPRPQPVVALPPGFAPHRRPFVYRRR